MADPDEPQDRIARLSRTAVAALVEGAERNGYNPCPLLGAPLLECATWMAANGHPDCALRAIRAAAASVIGRGVQGFVLAPDDGLPPRADPPAPGESDDAPLSLDEMSTAGGVH